MKMVVSSCLALVILMTREQENSGRICRVCNCLLSEGRGKSNEHIIPKWMQEHYGLKKRKIAYTPLESLDLPVSMQLTPPAKRHPQRHHNFGKLLLGSVCKKCNDGWMSQIESAAKNELIELIDGKDINENSLSVARWAIKTAYIMTAATDPPVGRVPQRHMFHLKRNADIPKGVTVFYRIDEESEWWFSSSMTFVTEVEEPAPNNSEIIVRRHLGNAYRYFFRLGRLTLVVHYWPNSIERVGYQSSLLKPIASSGQLYEFDDDFPGFPVPGLIYDLAIRSTKVSVSFHNRSNSDLCFCGSGLITQVCILKDHPADTAGNWGLL